MSNNNNVNQCIFMSEIFLPFLNRDLGPILLGKIKHKSVKLGKWKTEQEIICIFGVNLEIFHRKKIF